MAKILGKMKYFNKIDKNQALMSKLPKQTEKLEIFS